MTSFDSFLNKGRAICDGFTLCLMVETSPLSVVFVGNIMDIADRENRHVRLLICSTVC